MVTVLTNITQRNPKAQIIIQSVTPMADSSTSYSDKLNNDTINAYNQRMQELCEEHRWYYLNVAEVFRRAASKRTIAAIMARWGCTSPTPGRKFG